MTVARIYHVGIVVEDLAAGMAELTESAGLSWGRVQQFDVTFATPEGERTLAPQFVLSLDGPPYVELLRRLDDSVWAAPGFHHLGLWSDDVAADSAALELRGCSWEQAIRGDAGDRAGGCYHLLPATGTRLELVSRATSRPALERYLAGGDYR